MVEVLPMKSDGKCMTYALMHQLQPESLSCPEKFKEESDRLRKDAVSYIKRNLSDFKTTILMSVQESTLEYRQKTPKGKIDGFLRNLETGKEWGGYETLVACSKLKEVQIKVMQEVWRDDIASANSIVIDSSSTKEICIVYRLTKDPEALLLNEHPKRNHYDSFLKLQTTGYVALNIYKPCYLYKDFFSVHFFVKKK